MDQYEFEKYLASQPQTPSAQPVGRFVKNAFDMDERVVLPAIYWRYVDWVIETHDENMEAWIKRCDEYREDKTLSENLMDWLYWDMCDRVKRDDPFPDFMHNPLDENEV
ncbi:hypothetical protein OEG84_16920 [Hoeflea sp. G2-23]|uniref:Uncharacterized protein n=1 Tax=Hoeflea algicola TaxID=2983763 RepID=A0ABT3ZC21_9HYPH|nr:hypothetical protein [Hoeflea algicola]MCY0149345.1 hypothetical protein [Hoeflea algicola]